jgi:hypothetical protein
MAQLRRTIFSVSAVGAVGDRNVEAANVWKTKVVGARIQVVAIQRDSTWNATSSSTTGISNCACIIIGARLSDARHFNAAVTCLTDIFHAWIG